MLSFHRIISFGNDFSDNNIDNYSLDDITAFMIVDNKD